MLMEKQKPKRKFLLKVFFHQWLIKLES
jgi:hypothetical protein